MNKCIIFLLLYSSFILSKPAAFGGGIYGSNSLGISGEFDIHFLRTPKTLSKPTNIIDSAKMELVSFYTLSTEAGTNGSRLGFGITNANVSQYLRLRPFSYTYGLSSIYAYENSDTYLGIDLKICLFIFSVKLGFFNMINNDFDQLYNLGVGFGI